MKPTFLPTYETLLTVVTFVPFVTVDIFVTVVTVVTKKLVTEIVYLNFVT